VTAFLPATSEITPPDPGGIGAGGRMVFTLTFADPPTGISLLPEVILIRNRALELPGFLENVHQESMK